MIRIELKSNFVLIGALIEHPKGFYFSSIVSHRRFFLSLSLGCVARAFPLFGSVHISPAAGVRNQNFTVPVDDVFVMYLQVGLS